MQLVIDPLGNVRCLYAEAVDLHVLGEPVIQRAGHVEPDAFGAWWADLSPVHGPKLGPFVLRSEALRAEEAWIVEHCFDS